MADSKEEVATKQNVEKVLLNCGICLKQYNHPKVLPCLHSFCAACLQNYIPSESLSITCPTCRAQSILPRDGIGALQDNKFLTNFLKTVEESSLCCSQCKSQTADMSKCTDCQDLFCDQCKIPHSDANGTAHNVASVSDKDKKSTEETNGMGLVCPNHNGQSLDFYCAACETAVCKNCTAMEHSTHRTLPLSEAIEEQKEMLQNVLKNAKQQIPTIKDAINVVQKVNTSLLSNYQEAEIKLNEDFEKLTKTIEQRKKIVLSSLETAFKEKQKTLNSQLKNLEEMIQDIDSCCNFTEKAVQHGNETEVLLVCKEMSEKLTELSSSDMKTSPQENEYLGFNDGEFQRVDKVIKNLGSIQTNSAIGYESTATGEALRRCYAGRLSIVSITTKNRNGELIKTGHSSIASELISSSGDVYIPDISDNKNGTYDVIYEAPNPGTFQLDIRLYGQPIKGAPFKVKAYSESDSLERPLSVGSRIPKTTAVKQRGTKRPSSSRSAGSNRKSNPIEDDLLMRVGYKGRNKGEFTNPQGVCCTQNNRIIVADSNNQCIQVFSNSGDLKTKFGTRGRSAGQLQRPTGVAVTVNGNYLIADYDNKWVSIFTPDGKYLNKLGTGKLLGPKGVVVDSNGHIIIVDNKASCVFVFQSNGKFLYKFGSRGNDEDQFAGPHFCAVNKEDDIVVSDFHNHCVKVFDSEGNFKFSFGSNGEGNGQFNAPTGVAIDTLGNILVADWGNSRIQVFDSQGSFLSYINTSADPLYGPQGLAVTSDGNVVVADSGNHCFKIYRYLQ